MTLASAGSDETEGKIVLRLVATEISKRSIPLSVPFRTAVREVASVEEIRVTLISDGAIQGVGSAAPTAAITGDTTGSIEAALTDYLLPRLCAMELDHEHEVFREVGRALQGNPSAKAAVDIALHDLYAKAQGQSLTAWLGGSIKPLFTDATVSLGTVEAMTEQAERLLAQGFSCLKVKLGGHDGRDMARLQAIRDEVGASMVLRVDANQAWSLGEAFSYLPVMVRLGVELVEQPLASDDLFGLGELTRQSALLIAADEAVYGLKDLLRIIQGRAADVINIKLMKSEGLYHARTMIQVARAAGLKVMIGSMMEGMTSLTAAACLASAYDVDFVDLDAGFFLTQAGVAGGISYSGPRIELPRALGLGVSYAS